MTSGNSTDQSISGNVLENQESVRTLPDDVVEALGQGRLSNVEYISSGATSSVYKATDNVLGKKVAIKLLEGGGAEDLMNFQSEAKTACKLDHHNLVKILNFGVTKKNHAYLIMDFVEGQSLESLVKNNGVLDIEAALPLLMQICDGMKHSHTKNIAHRDLKTANVIIQDFGTENVKAIVVDFGLARERQQSQGITTQGITSGRVKGSPMTISPEQAEGKPGDWRSDIYSLGCITFRVLTGRFPFQANDVFELLLKHINDQPPRLSELAPGKDFGDALEHVVERMLAKVPSDRYESMDDVKHALADVLRIRELEKTPVKPGSTRTPKVVRKRVRRESVISIIAMILIAVAYGGWKVWQNFNAKATQQSNTKSLQDKQLKLKELFRVDRGHFMFKLDQKQLIPIAAHKITDETLDCFDGTTLPTSAINLSYTKITGKGLRYLANIPNLELELNYTTLTDEGYRELGKLKNLCGLSLQKTGFGLKEMKYLANSRNMRELNFDYCQNLNDECLKIAGSSMPLLEAFVSRDTPKIGDAGVSALTRCQYLKILQVDGSQVTDKSMDDLLKLTNIDDLRVNRARAVTGKALQKLTARFPRMRFIGFGFTKLKPADLAYLRNCPGLTYVEMPGVPIGDDEMKVFSELKDLQYLYLSEVVCSDKGLRYLYPKKSMVKIVWLHVPNASNQAFEELQNQLPNTEIYTPGRSQKMQEKLHDVIDLFNEKYESDER